MIVTSAKFFFLTGFLPNKNFVQMRQTENVSAWTKGCVFWALILLLIQILVSIQGNGLTQTTVYILGTCAGYCIRVVVLVYALLFYLNRFKSINANWKGYWLLVATTLFPGFLVVQLPHLFPELNSFSGTVQVTGFVWQAFILAKGLKIVHNIRWSESIRLSVIAFVILLLFQYTLTGIRL